MLEWYKLEGGLGGGEAHTPGEGGRTDERNGFVSGEFPSCPTVVVTRFS